MRKCGVDPFRRQKQCPPIQKGNDPDRADCQGCPLSVETNTMGGWPVTKLSGKDLLAANKLLEDEVN